MGMMDNDQDAVKLVLAIDDRLVDQRTDICDSRVAFMTENFRNSNCYTTCDEMIEKARVMQG